MFLSLSARLLGHAVLMSRMYRLRDPVRGLMVLVHRHDVVCFGLEHDGRVHLLHLSRCGTTHAWCICALTNECWAINGLVRAHLLRLRV